MTTEELLARRMAGQHLLSPAEPDAVCHDLMALQAQYWRNAAHALRIRSSAAPDWDALCKSWSLRGTLQLCREADLPLLLCQGRKHFLRPQDKTDGADVYLDGALCLTAARKRHWLARIPALIDGGIDERDALRLACAAEGMTADEARCVFDPWGGLLRGLCEDGRLAYRAQERKAFRRCTPFEPMAADEAGPVLAMRYFTHYGPASLRDAAQFFGVTQAVLRRWTATLPLAADEWEGATLYSLPWDEPTDPLPACVFLAGFDPLLLGYDKRTNPILPPAYLRGIYTMTGIVHPAILLRGRIAGRWKRTGRRLELTLFAPLSPGDRSLLEAAAQSLWDGVRVRWSESR